MMKTIKECSEITGLQYSFIRGLCIDRKIKFIRSGVKYYIYLDSLLEFCGDRGECE